MGFSYITMVALIVMMVALHLATPILTILFSTFALRRLHFGDKKWISIVVFSCLVCLVFFGFGGFLRHAARALPNVAEESIPRVIAFADEHGVKLPFDNVASLKSLVAREMSERFTEVTDLAKLATKEFVIMLISLVVAANIFLKPLMDLDPAKHPFPRNLYTLFCDEMAIRFRTFYESFETVMGAQIIISAINTALTAVFILCVDMRHSLVLIGVTFLCGLLPIIGNIISNCVIVAVGFTMSPTMAIAALCFLVILHKLEYFLNSKIIGDRISNPVWLTMMGLIIGEKIMGIPGMILAPVILFYVKVETAKIRVAEPAEVIPGETARLTASSEKEAC